MKTLHKIPLKRKVERKTTSADLAHSIQTPLAILKSELFFLRQEIADNPRASLCDKLIDEIAWSLRSFLEMSRIENTAHETPLRRFCLSDVFEETSRHLETLARVHGITFNYAVSPNIYMTGVQEKLKELLIQIVSNSISYIGNGPRKEIYLILSKRNSAATLTVKDTGLGIAKEDLPHIFEPFYRGKNVQNQKISGTGLGLSSVKKIVAMHNAHIKIESVVKKGTQTTIRIPL